MASFLADENLGRTTVAALRREGLDVIAIEDVGLRGATDNEIFEHAVSNGLVLVTGDLDFSNVHRFPVGSHHGVVIHRFPMSFPRDGLARELALVLRSLSEEELRGSLVIIGPGDVRMRSPGSEST